MKAPSLAVPIRSGTPVFQPARGGQPSKVTGGDAGATVTTAGIPSTQALTNEGQQSSPPLAPVPTGTTGPHGGVAVDALWAHLKEHPGTAAMRDLRATLVAEGIPMDKLTGTPGLGSHDAWQNAPNPEAKFHAYMRWVVSSTQYSPSTAPAFLAQAALTWLKSAATPEGVLTSERVSSMLGPKALAIFEALHADVISTPPPTPMHPQLALRARAGNVSGTPSSTSTSTSLLANLPANMVGAGRASPDRGHLQLAPEVIRRLPFKMMTVDMRTIGVLQRKLTERITRRDPARRIAEHLGKGGVESPKIPALQAVADAHVGAAPFKDTKIMVLQHLYASTQSILDACVACGAKAEDITVMGKPYSGNMAVAASMVERGFQLVVPSLHQSEFSDHEGHMDILVHEAVTGMLAGSTPEQKLLVLDDGGHVAKIVHQHFPKEAHRFRFVEQTQRGANAVKEVAASPGGLRAPVINVAESRAKKDHESPSIGYSVWKETSAIIDKLSAQGVTVPKSATVLGFGAVGGQVARELKEAGYDVHVYDPDPARQAQATSLGFTAHADKDAALPHASVLVSATGRTALELGDVEKLPKESVLVNAASANNELNATNMLTLQMLSANALMGTVRIGPKGVEVPRSLISAVDTAQLDEQGHLWDSFAGKSVDLGEDNSATQRDRVVKTKSGQDLYVAHAGFVVNLTDDADPIPPRYIGLTRSLLFAALVQSASETRTGLVDLDDGVQQQIIDVTEGALQATGESLDDPRF